MVEILVQILTLVTKCYHFNQLKGESEDETRI